MNPFLKDLIKTFESRTINPRERYKEFLFHCYMIFDKKIGSKSSEKFKNKYSIMRDNTLKYLLANEKTITLELGK